MRADLTDAPVSDLICSFRPPRARVRMVGDFDLSTCEHLADVLACLRLRGCRTVEVDAQEATFVDASTLRVLHVGAERLRAEGGALVVVAASPVFARIVALAGCTDLFPRPERGLSVVPDLLQA